MHTTITDVLCLLLTDIPCDLDPVANDPTKYLHGGYVRDCAPGTVFSRDECICVVGGITGKSETFFCFYYIQNCILLEFINAITFPGCSSDPLIKFPFTVNFDTTQCLGGTATPLGYPPPTINGELCFDGQTQRVEVKQRTMLVT